MPQKGWMRLALIGNISEFEAASGALRDFVWESTRGEQVWFVPSEDALHEKLVSRRRE